MFVFTYNKDKYEESGIDRRQLETLITKHRSDAFPKFQKCMDYYEGKHAIEEKTRTDGAPNNKTVCNHAKDISDTASGYFMGSPITYDHDDEKLEKLIEAFDKAEVDDTDQDNALSQSICGLAHDYTYIKEGDSYLCTVNLDSRHTFIVYDDTIEQNELFGVYYDVVRDDVNNTDRYEALVCDDESITRFILYPGTNISDKDRQALEVVGDSQPHNLGYVPITEYRNNKFGIGDFESQIGLIDAYNTLMADRINDKEQFIDSILVLYGAVLGDDDDETEKAQKQLKRRKLLEMPIDARAEYLSRTLDEASVETLRKALKEDIYTLSHVPNLTDENFAGNSSGVAMEYKLLGLEMLTKVKERYYRKGLRKRIRMFCHFLGLKQIEIDAGAVVPNFSRALPRNVMEIAQIIGILQGNVSQKTLIKLLPFVENPDEEVEAVKEENAERVKMQQELFAEQEGTQNTPPDEENKPEKDEDELNE